MASPRHSTNATSRKRPASRPRVDVHQAVTDAIVAQLEEGAELGQWRRPWVATGPGASGLPHSIAGRAYRGVNVPILMVSAASQGYSSNLWGTYKAWQSEGAQVLKGQRGTLVTGTLTHRPILAGTVVVNVFREDVDSCEDPTPILQVGFDSDGNADLILVGDATGVVVDESTTGATQFDHATGTVTITLQSGSLPAGAIPGASRWGLAISRSPELGRMKFYGSVFSTSFLGLPTHPTMKE